MLPSSFCWRQRPKISNDLCDSSLSTKLSHQAPPEERGAEGKQREQTERIDSNRIPRELTPEGKPPRLTHFFNKLLCFRLTLK